MAGPAHRGAQLPPELQGWAAAAATPLTGAMGAGAPPVAGGRGAAGAPPLRPAEEEEHAACRPVLPLATGSRSLSPPPGPGNQIPRSRSLAGTRPPAGGERGPNSGRAGPAERPVAERRNAAPPWRWGGSERGAPGGGSGGGGCGTRGLRLQPPKPDPRPGTGHVAARARCQLGHAPRPEATPPCPVVTPPWHEATPLALRPRLPAGGRHTAAPRRRRSLLTSPSARRCGGA